MPQTLIEDDIMFNALHKIAKELENLYINQTSMQTSKYAKKRIKVDIKVFIKNCCDMEKLKFSTEYKNKHFDLEGKADSEIKQILIKILVNRCGTKPDEFASFFEKAPIEVVNEEKVTAQNLMTQVKQQIQQEYTSEKTVTDMHVDAETEEVKNDAEAEYNKLKEEKEKLEKEEQ